MEGGGLLKIIVAFCAARVRLRSSRQLWIRDEIV